MKHKYNTMFDVVFSIDHDCHSPIDVPLEVLLDALQARVNYLRANPEDAGDAFGVCDTYEHDPEEPSP